MTGTARTLSNLMFLYYLSDAGNRVSSRSTEGQVSHFLVLLNGLHKQSPHSPSS